MTLRTDIAVMREAVVKVTRTLANKGVTVTQMGSRAYCTMNRVNGELETVNIPQIPDNASHEFIRAIHGFIDHELGHVLFSDFKRMSKWMNEQKRAVGEKASKGLVGMHNIVEDVFIEKEMRKLYRGSNDNLNDVSRFVCNEHIIPSVTKAVSEGNVKAATVGLLMPAIRKAGGDNSFVDALDKFPEIADELEKVIAPYADAIANVKSTEDCISIAEKVYEAMKPPKEPPPPEDAEGDDEDSEEKAPGDGTGDPDNDEPSDGNSEEENDDKGDSDSEGDSDDDEDGPEDEEETPESEDDEDEEETPESEDDDEEGEDEGESDDDEGSEDEDDDEESDDGEDEDGEGSEDEDDEGSEDEDEGESDDGEDDESEGEDDEGSDDESGDDEGSDDDDESDGDSGDGESGDDESDDDDDEGEKTEAGVGANEDFHLDMSDEDMEDADGIEGSMSEALKKSMEEMYAKTPRKDMKYVPFSTDADYLGPYYPAPGATDRHDVHELITQAARQSHVLQGDFERLFAAQSASFYQPGLRKGRLNPTSLHRLLTHDDRIFRKKIESRTTETAVSLVVDLSGSMSGSKVQLAMLSALIFGKLLNHVNITNEIIGFTTRPGERCPGATERRAAEERIRREMAEVTSEFSSWSEQQRHLERYSRWETLATFVFKSFTERLTRERELGMSAMVNDGRQMMNNADGDSVLIAAERLLTRTEKRKVMIVMSDGYPAVNGPESSVTNHLHNVIRDVKAAGVEMFGIGIECDSVRTFYPDYVVLNHATELPKIVLGKMRDYLLN